MLTYQIPTGILTQDGAYVGTGWAGQPPYKNDIAGVTVHNVGPLPPGSYSIGPSYTHPHLGPLTMNLLPASSNEMYGRGSFRIHGASPTHPETSSEGCVIMPHDVRERIANGSDRNLTVVA
jgi:hypothetical protein